jgi:hypothetical protein
MNSDTSTALANLDMQVYVTEKETAIYVKLTGFDDIDDASEYAEFLTKNLPLLLTETEVIH